MNDLEDFLPGYSAKSHFGMTENLWAQVISSQDDLYDKLYESFNTPILRASDLDANYRFLNYLEEVGLIKDERIEKGTGWRKYSLTDFLYILIIIELRKYGLKAEVIKPFADLFLTSENKVAHNSIMAVLGGVEMTLVFQSDGTCAVLDPAHTSFYKRQILFGLVPERKSGELQFNLSYFVNQVLESIGKKTVEIKFSYDTTMDAQLIKGSLSHAEVHAVLEMRGLSEKDKLIAQRTSSGTEVLFNVERSEPTDDEFAQRLAEMIGEDFGELNAVKRGGKMMSLKKRKTTRIKDEN